MNILVIGSDRSLFEKNSESRKRILEYGKLANSLHIIIFSKKDNFEIQNLGNVFLYPTNSKNKFLYFFDAIKMGLEVIGLRGEKWLISCQDAFECGLVGYFISKKTNNKLQLQIHTDFLSPFFKKESFLNKIRVKIAKFLIPRANCIRVVSKRIKKSIISTFLKIKIPIIVLPVFVDVEKIEKLQINDDLHKKYTKYDFIILMASRLTKEKNIYLAIDAMKGVLRNYQKVGLIIVGEGPEKNKIKSKIENCHKEANIRLESWSNNLASYYKTADLYLLTSNYEGYGRTVVEAMAANCPIIMTDVGLANETLIDKKDGIIIPVNGKKELSKAIINLIEDKNLKKYFTENSKKLMNFWPKKEDYLRSYRDSWISCD